MNHFWNLAVGNLKDEECVVIQHDDVKIFVPRSMFLAWAKHLVGSLSERSEPEWFLLVEGMQEILKGMFDVDDLSVEIDVGRGRRA